MLDVQALMTYIVNIFGNFFQCCMSMKIVLEVGFVATNPTVPVSSNSETCSKRYGSLKIRIYDADTKHCSSIVATVYTATVTQTVLVHST